jgi:amino-acid N-acetyltransferase
MNKSKLREQVENIRQAFGYIDKFKGETFVIKIDSELISGSLFPLLIKDLTMLHRMGIRIILVPGTRSRIDEILATYGVECKIVNGVRISPPDAIQYIKMAAFDVSNKLMTLLAECGSHAVIGNWVRAKSIGVKDGIDFQNSGVVERLQTEIISNVLNDNLIPIFPNIGWNAKGKPYNLSSNELACTLSTALKAAKLFFLTCGKRITVNYYKSPNDIYVDDDSVISQLTVNDARLFLECNSDKKDDEMIEYVNYALRACTGNVRRVHIIDGSEEGAILKEIFSNRGLGTMIYSNQLENIRPITPADIPEVLSLMQPAVEASILIPRTAADLEENINDYFIYEVDEIIHGSGALHVYGSMGEIAAIIVDKMYSNLGIGKRIISFLIDKAAELKLKSVFVLTTQTSDWFAQLDFSEASVDDLPVERREKYNMQRNSRILKKVILETKKK